MGMHSGLRVNNEKSRKNKVKCARKEGWGSVRDRTVKFTGPALPDPCLPEECQEDINRSHKITATMSLMLTHCSDCLCLDFRHSVEFCLYTQRCSKPKLSSRMHFDRHLPLCACHPDSRSIALNSKPLFSFPSHPFSLETPSM